MIGAPLQGDSPPDRRGDRRRMLEIGSAYLTSCLD